MKLIAISGASGYIGRHLVDSLLADGGYRIKLLTRSESDRRHVVSGGEIFKGDLLAVDSLSGFLEPGCILINLVYLWDAGVAANMEAMRNLVSAIKEVGIERMIHVSTAAVSGRTSQDLVDEAMPCMPTSEYGITKLKVEALLRDACQGNFDLAILRPTSVFGPGAEPLSKLARDLRTGLRFKNYMKSSLFGTRRMNLVHVANVIGAIVYLANRNNKLGGEIFIVSDDDSDTNNFRDVESALMDGLGVPSYRLPRLPIPLGALQLLLSALGRNNANPKCSYSCEKLLRLGYVRPVNFEAGLSECISACTSDYSTQSGTDAHP